MNRRAHLAIVWCVVGAIALGSVSACATGDDMTLEVFAASSLTNAFGDLATDWETANPGVEVRVNTAGSSALREQLRDGAAAQVFASANEAIVDELISDETILGTPKLMATNELVLAVPRGNPAQIASLDDLVDDSLLVGVCVPGVPCGDLAQQFFAAAGVSIAPDTEEPDVRSLTRRLAEGELDAALIYATDAASDADNITIIETNVAVPMTRYPIVTVAADDEQAQAFVDFVLSDVGQAILLSWGFQPA